MSPTTMLLMIVLGVAIVFVGEVRPVRAAQPNITHTLLLKSQLPDAGGEEVTVSDTQYAPGATANVVVGGAHGEDRACVHPRRHGPNRLMGLMPPELAVGQKAQLAK